MQPVAISSVAVHPKTKISVTGCSLVASKKGQKDQTRLFTMDTWTSPNHKAIMAFSVHFTNEGKVKSLILDVVEVAKVNTESEHSPYCNNHNFPSLTPVKPSHRLLQMS